MKTPSIVLAIILLTVITFNVRNSLLSFNALQDLSFVEGEIHAFDPANENIPGYDEVQKRMSKMIVEFKTSVKRYSTTDLVLNLLVTIFTAAAALVTTISTIKNAAVSKAAAIVIAVIAFVSSLLSFSQSQVGKWKEEMVKKKDLVIAIRSELEALKPEEVVKQLPRINRRLDEEF